MIDNIFLKNTKFLILLSYFDIVCQVLKKYCRTLKILRYRFWNLVHEFLGVYIQENISRPAFSKMYTFKQLESPLKFIDFLMMNGMFIFYKTGSCNLISSSLLCSEWQTLPKSQRKCNWQWLSSSKTTEKGMWGPFTVADWGYYSTAGAGSTQLESEIIHQNGSPPPTERHLCLPISGKTHIPAGIRKRKTEGYLTFDSSIIDTKKILFPIRQVLHQPECYDKILWYLWEWS